MWLLDTDGRGFICVFLRESNESSSEFGKTKTEF